MSLPPRLWLPDGVHELPTAVPAGQLSGLWPGGPAQAIEAMAQLPPSTAPRLRRRALLRADAGLPERPVLIEWLPRSDLDAAEAERRKGACHVNLLRLHHVGLADPGTAYLISEAPAGVDLLTVHRAAAGQLPAWWAVAVVAAAARGLGALHQHVQRRGGSAHGGIELSALFVAWSGAVQLLAYAPRGQPAPPHAAAPEALFDPRLVTAAADVYALAAVLKALLPASALARGSLPPLIRRCLLPHADERPALSAVQAALEAALGELAAPLNRAAAIGELLASVCPRAATVDLADAEWGDSSRMSFATLPATLSPLSAGAVQLSPTWVMAPPEPTLTLDKAAAPQPPSRRWPVMLGAATLALALLGGVALWGTAKPVGTRAAPASGAAGPAPAADPAGSAAARGALSSRSSGRAAVAAPAPAPDRGAAPASVPLTASADSVRWGALRLQLLRVHLEPDRVRVQLRLTNPTAQPLTAELAALTLGPAGRGERQPPQPPPAPLLLGAGRIAVVALDYPLAAPTGGPGALALQLQPP